MIKNLKNKIRWLLISLLSLCLISILASSMFLQLNKSNQDLQKDLGDALNNGKQSFNADYWNELKDSVQRSVFVAEYNRFSQTVQVSSSNWKIQQDVLLEMMNQALSRSSFSGELSDFHVAYQKVETKLGFKVAFVDVSDVLATRRDLWVSSLLIFVIAESSIIALSFFLSNLLLKPVEQSVKQQKQFIADASHELKNPLAIISANTQILKHHQEDVISNQMKWIDNTQGEVSRMHHLVHQLLFLAASDSYDHQIDFSRINLSQCLLGSCLLVESMAFEANKPLNLQIEPELYISGNRELLEKMSGLLFENAIKYGSEHQPITISLTKNHHQAILTFANESNDVDPQNLDHLFDRFYRQEKSRNRQDGNYGLGLAIVKEIVLSHHGNIECVYQAPTIKFIITLPLLLTTA